MFATGELRLAYSADFDTKAANTTELVWVTYLDNITQDGWVTTSQVLKINDINSTGADLKRVSYGYSGRWFLDRDLGARMDILMAYEQSPGMIVLSDMVVNGARNIDPAFLSLDPQTSAGLLAYQSDISGSFDVYVLSINTKDVFRVTTDGSWTGSPNWVQPLN
jgi:hypothetical protein